MKDYFIADTHLGHGNIIRYCKRPFLTPGELDWIDQGIQFKLNAETIARHDAAIISNINDVVGNKDRLWVLGDFCWGGHSVAMRYLDDINCSQVHLIRGNHDESGVERHFSSVHDYLMLEIEGQHVFMCHYPMRSWDKSHHGSWNLFGHVHGNLQDVPHLLTLDVGVDTHDFRPWSFAQIKEYMAKRMPAWEAYRKGWKDKDAGGMAPATHG